MAGAERVLVGRLEQLPVGSTIHPEFAARVRGDGVVDWTAACGVVRAYDENRQPGLAAFWTMWPVLGATMGNRRYGGHLSTYAHPLSGKLSLHASAGAKETVATWSDQHNGVVGYLHQVDGDLTPVSDMEPGTLVSATPLRVLASYALHYTDLEDRFGGRGLPALTDPQDHPTVSRDISMFLASGALDLAS